jgi:hypothetical protein
MNWTPGITPISLISLYPNSEKYFVHFDKIKEQVVLAYVINTFFKTNVDLTMLERPTLRNVRNALASLYNQINSNTPDIKDSYTPHLQQFINCFFWHLFIEKSAYAQMGGPYLFKINNRIFLHFSCEMSIAPEMFSLITSAEYPQIFNDLNQIDSYLYKNITKQPNGTLGLFLPEFPFFFKKQVYKLYNFLIESYIIIEPTIREEDFEAAIQVKEYLIKMRDFFDIKE